MYLNNCLNSSSPKNEWCTEPSMVRFQFVFNVFIVGLIIIFGFVGNFISILVLKKDWKRSSMNVLLCTLAVYDVLFLLLSSYYIVFARGIIIYFSHLLPELSKNFISLTWYLGNVTRYGRNWIAVSVALDRFIMVRNPFRAHQRNTSFRAQIVSASIAFATFVYNIPRFWDYAKAWDKRTCKWIIIMNPNLSNFHKYVYNIILQMLIMIYGPMILLIVFNSLLTISLVRAKNVRQSLMAKQNQARPSGQMETKMLIVVIGVFLFTELPSSILQAITTKNCFFYRILIPICDGLTILNSSINFVIYSMCGQRFRENLRKMFFKTNRDQDLLNRQKNFNTNVTIVSMKKQNNVDSKDDNFSFDNTEN
uniref:GCR070 n=1 Tax=Schmidtea mediterranea TaxID=79327 RepID=A0A193KUI2_SCHMD|nr:GCR070 [Schmidtea mediterranea]